MAILRHWAAAWKILSDRVIALIDERGFLRRDAERLLPGDTPDRCEIYKLASHDR